MLLNYRLAIVEKRVLVHACWVKTGKSLKAKRTLISLIIPKWCARMAFGVYFQKKRRVGHRWTHVMSHFLAVGWNRCFSSSLVLRTKTSFMCGRKGSGQSGKCVVLHANRSPFRLPSLGNHGSGLRLIRRSKSNPWEWDLHFTWAHRSGLVG